MLVLDTTADRSGAGDRAPDAAVRAGVHWVWLLHGRGADAVSTTPLLTSLAAAAADGRLGPLVIAAVDGPWSARAGWWVDSAYAGSGSVPAGRPVETAVLGDVLPQVEALVGPPAGRQWRTVAGVSMGGAGALRWVMARPDLFGSALLLSPSVYDVPPPGSSARTSGAFGTSGLIFDERRWATTMALDGLRSARADAGGTRVVTVVGDEEPAQPGFDGTPADLTLQAARLHAALRRCPGVETRLRVVGGGHDWPIWTAGAVEGLRLLQADRGSPP